MVSLNLVATAIGSFPALMATVSDPLDITSFSLWAIAAVVAVAFTAELVDSSLGMGYGTMLTPLLLCAGFARESLIPAILISEFMTGCCATLCHHHAGNAQLLPRPRRMRYFFAVAAKSGWRKSFIKIFPAHMRSAWLLGSCSVLGASVAAVAGVKLPGKYVNLYIAILLIAIGVFILITRKKTFAFSWSRTAGLGLVAAFNKGISGGGYGPLVVGGQLLSGQSARASVGIVSLSEAMASLAAILTIYLAGGKFDWPLTITLTSGALLSAPLAAIAVKIIPQLKLHAAIGALTMLMGLITLQKML